MSDQPGTHGYLALMQVLAITPADKRLTGASRNALWALARYAGPDGSCCVSLARLAEVLCVTRQAVQIALRVAERCGYVSSKRRYRTTGAEGAKVWTFNLDLEGALACPVVWPEGVQAPELAGGCKRQSLQGVQAPELAHKKPPEETTSEETNASPPGGSLGKRPARQQHLLLPIQGRSLVHARVADHNRDLRSAASGRLWSRWCDLDPELSLYDMLGIGADDVQERALDHEIQKRGRGCAYIAGAIERATRGEIRARDILAGTYRRAS